MTDGYFPTLRPHGDMWVAKVTVHGSTFRAESRWPAAALSHLIRKLAGALDEAVTEREAEHDG